MNTRQPPKPKRYYGRVEFLACREEIEMLREQGYTLRSIHDLLVSEKRMTMHYRSFCQYIKRYDGKGTDGLQRKMLPTPVLLSSNNEARIKSKSKGFGHQATVDTNDLIGSGD